MEARRLAAAWIAAIAVALLGANYRSANFVVETADPVLAERFATTSERLRHNLAIEWLGEAMPNWYQPCAISVQVGPNLPAGGATTFVFDRGEVYGWRMNIQGSADRVLDSVLPHEITHMIFASYFRAPLPRWADEGGATSVECASERAKHQKMLLQFLRTGRGIAFSDMFVMTEYPADMLPLYAQAHSLADYLIQQGGRRKYVSFLAEAMHSGNWVSALETWYAVKDLGTLQANWVAWVGRGSPPLPKAPEVSRGSQLAARPPRPEPNLIHHIAGAAAIPLTAGDAVSTHVARPQPIQRPRQVVVE